MQAAGRQQCVAALICVYDHHQRELPKRLTRDFHDHHDLAQATLHVHLDHESCMEVTVLKGPGEDVQELADHVIAEAGIDAFAVQLDQRKPMILSSIPMWTPDLVKPITNANSKIV